jgi:protein phosphatase 2C family protein 2/3
VVISHKGKVHALSDDHKPFNLDEAKRIRRAGGFVAYGRINGSLAVSRAFGDFDYKKRTDLNAYQQLVIAAPDITVVQCNPEIDFLVMATDGVWDVMSNQQVVTFIQEKMKDLVPVQDICTLLIERCREPAYCVPFPSGDNIAVIIAIFK